VICSFVTEFSAISIAPSSFSQVSFDQDHLYCGYNIHYTDYQRFCQGGIAGHNYTEQKL
jgi:hypothetical protein